MKIGFLGLGKLGLPCALVADSKGHEVFGYDISPAVKDILDTKHMPYREEGSPELLKDHNINWSSVEEVVSNSDIIFVPIQTPHDERFEGTTRMPDERVDFDYSYLKAGMDTLSKEIKKQGEDKIVVIISTVLPGTIRNEIKPLLNDHVKLCYNPFFIAMGTTRHDFENPEFVLFGMDDEDAYNKAKEFYATIHSKPVYKCSIEEAEMIKVTYNTYITMKICLANVVMEAAHKLENVNCDNVMKGLFLANERLMSPKYLLGGMGDGGGCHPRDNIALSWLAQKLDMSYDWYESLMVCREDQTDWLADLIMEHRGSMPVTILGKCFKKETNLTVGSPSILLKNLLDERGKDFVDMYDPWVDDYVLELDARCYFIGTNHDKFLDYKFPAGSVVLDPWGMIEDQENVKVIRIGR
tara:strand:- start:1459 stop:2691 length:1233 start_codon:yes stop_codon:yes gene_type:complete